MLKVFSGYDPRVPAGFEVFRYSVERHCSMPVTVAALDQEKLRAVEVYTRAEDAKASTPFSLTRFLVPFLCNYEGYALVCDGSDMICTRDIADLFSAYAHTAAVSCVQHEYRPAKHPKFFGQRQHVYPRKNWSSLMLFDCARCKSLSLNYVNTATPAELHRFKWAEDSGIGSLPTEWNWLVGEPEYSWESHNERPAIIHYTLGLPIVPKAVRTELDFVWFSERAQLIGSIEG
jgi:hypothetical protein